MFLSRLVFPIRKVNYTSYSAPPGRDIKYYQRTQRSASPDDLRSRGRSGAQARRQWQGVIFARKTNWRQNGHQLTNICPVNCPVADGNFSQGSHHHSGGVIKHPGFHILLVVFTRREVTGKKKKLIKKIIIKYWIQTRSVHKL